MEQKIGIIVNPLKTLGEFCKKHQLKIIYKLVLSTVGQFSSPAILNYRLIVYQKNGEYLKEFRFNFVLIIICVRKKTLFVQVKYTNLWLGPAKEWLRHRKMLPTNCCECLEKVNFMSISRVFRNSKQFHRSTAVIFVKLLSLFCFALCYFQEECCDSADQLHESDAKFNNATVWDHLERNGSANFLMQMYDSWHIVSRYVIRSKWIKFLWFSKF